MAYADHPAFEVSDWNQRIWRYISVPQLLSILETEALWFTRADEFDDPFEGTVPDRNLDELSATEEVRLPRYMVVNAFRGTGREKTSTWESTPNLRSEVAAYRRISFINCWHQNGTEADTMWRANLEGPEGVVVESTAADLKRAFSAFDGNDVYIGEVEYIDYRTDRIPEDNLLYPFTYKRKGFEQENELRAVVTKLPTEHHPGYEGVVPGERVPLEWEEQPPGMYVDLDVEALIEGIRIAPTASSWLAGTLSDVVSRCGYDVPVTESSLSTAPLHDG